MIKPLFNLLITSGKSHFTREQYARILLCLRGLRLPILGCLLLLNAELVRVAVAHFQSGSTQASLLSTKPTDLAEAPVDPLGNPAPTADPAGGSPPISASSGGDEDVVLGEPAVEHLGFSDGDTTTSTASVGSGNAGKETGNREANRENDPQVQQAVLAETPGIEHGEPKTGQEASMEDDRLAAPTPEQLQEAAKRSRLTKERLTKEWSVRKVDLIRGLATAQGSTRRAIGIVTNNLKMILECLAQFPMEKLHAPLPTIEEANMQAGESGTQTAAESAGQTSPERGPGRQLPPSFERPATLPALVLANPRDSGGQVRFLLNDVFHVLLPGEVHRLEFGQPWRIQFHRGGNFGNADYTLPAGRYEFQVTDDGWQLMPVADPVKGGAE